jgi:hypothetical protein
MNPLVIDLLGSLLRWGLTAVAGWLVSHGIWTQAQATSFAVAGSMALLTLGWSLWKSYSKRLKIVTALSLPKGSTELDVEYQIAMPHLPTPSVTTPKGTRPVPQ